MQVKVRSKYAYMYCNEKSLSQKTTMCENELIQLIDLREIGYTYVQQNIGQKGTLRRDFYNSP